MSKVDGLKGSYFKNGKGHQVRYPLGWSDKLQSYDELIEQVTNEADAIARIKEINTFVYHGGDPKTLKYGSETAKKEEELEQLNFRAFCDLYTIMRRKKVQLDKLSKRTLETDATHINRLNLYIGDMPLKEIDVEVIENMEMAMRNKRDKRNDGKALSGTYILKIIITLQSILSYAVKQKYIDVNPCREYEKPKRDTKEKQSLDAEQTSAIISKILADQSAKPMGLLLCTVAGLRLSEMLALTWQEVLFDDNAIVVEFSMERDSQKRKKTKTERKDVVPIPPEATDALRAWKEIQKAWFKKRDIKYSNKVPVVHSEKGNFIACSNYERWVFDNKSKYGFPDFATMHTLRHSYITLTISECGADLGTARGMARHASLEMTSKYSHALDPNKIRTANRMGALLFPHSEKETCYYCRLWTESPDDKNKGVCWAQEKSKVVSITHFSDPCAIEKYQRKAD